VRRVVGLVDWEAVELLAWESHCGQSWIKSATKLRNTSDAHTLCSFCKMFSNTRGHSDLSSGVRIRVTERESSYATYMSMEPSRAACSRISSHVDMMVVVQCINMLQAHCRFKVEMSMVKWSHLSNSC
jgi:hypothetical protein